MELFLQIAQQNSPKKDTVQGVEVSSFKDQFRDEGFVVFLTFIIFELTLYIIYL